MEKQKIAVIAGAGPAGLTAAYELLRRTGIKPIVIEQDHQVGGISRTVVYKGNRMDIGGHRFFSKSDRVMNWWFSLLPLQKLEAEDHIVRLRYQQRETLLEAETGGVDPETSDRVMLVRNRLSRIFYRRRFFDYPIRMNRNTIKNLGFEAIIRIGWSYLMARIRPVRPEKSLEDFFINRFGRVLYETFFRDYTEKVWGVTCREIKPEWGAQRVKGLSVSKALWHALKSIFPKEQTIHQKDVETSLIDRFLYPKFGPGQMWELVAEAITTMGGEIRLGWQVVGSVLDGKRISEVSIRSLADGQTITLEPDYFFSTMAVSDLIGGMTGPVPDRIRSLAGGLMYRDFLTVGLLLKKMSIKDAVMGESKLVQDNWIYIQEGDVKVGRIQVFNNWSPWLVSDPDTVWLGMEYFCQEGDPIWSMEDQKMIQFAINELAMIGLAAHEDLLDGTVVRMPKTYPAYFGTYEFFNEIKDFSDPVSNLILIGRNGMHRYNNQDHSMLTAMVAVDGLAKGFLDKSLIWDVNTDDAYHEEDKR